VAAIAKPHDDLIAFAQKAAADPDEQGVDPGADVVAVVLELERGAVAGVRRSVVRRLGSANCGFAESEAVRQLILMAPVSSMPNLPAV
jgi:hypothetical protein